MIKGSLKKMSLYLQIRTSYIRTIINDPYESKSHITKEILWVGKLVVGNWSYIINLTHYLYITPCQTDDNHSLGLILMSDDIWIYL